MGRFGCPRNKGVHERAALNYSVMDLRDPQDDVLPSILAATRAS